MKKTIIAIVIAVVALVSSFFFFGGGQNTKEDETVIIPESSVTRLAWVEVVSGKAYEVKEESGVKSNPIVIRELFTGDEVGQGQSIKISDPGRVIVHFPDGSVMRSDDGTIYNIKDYSYDKESGKLSLVASLNIGRIWSKIVALSTPDSVWQVETGSAVATVRGTAFGISTDGKQSEVFGSEHSVSVALLDPTTHETVSAAPIVVGEGKTITIAVEDVKKIAAAVGQSPVISAPSSAIGEVTAKYLVVQDIPEKVKNGDWFKKNEIEDKNVIEKLNEIKKKAGDDPQKQREEIKKEIDGKFEVFKKAKKEKSIPVLIEKEKDIDADAPKDKEIIKKEEAKSTEIEKVISAEVRLPELKIEEKRILDGVNDGEKMEFRAIFYSGDRKIDVTDTATWKVVGPIGSVISPGVVSAKLDDSVSEYGEGYGFVVATFKDKNTDKELLGQSSKIRVVMPLPEDVPEDIWNLN